MSTETLERVGRIIPSFSHLEPVEGGYDVISNTMGRLLASIRSNRVTYCHENFPWLTDNLNHYLASVRETCPYCGAEAWNPALNCCDSCCCQ